MTSKTSGTWVGRRQWGCSTREGGVGACRPSSAAGRLGARRSGAEGACWVVGMGDEALSWEREGGARCFECSFAGRVVKLVGFYRRAHYY